MTASSLRVLGPMVALPVGVLLSLAACKVEDGPTGLLIRQDQYMEPGGAQNCVVPATATSKQRTEGILDVTIPSVSDNGYLFYPLVENQLGPLSGLASGGEGQSEEKNSITLKAFHVSLSVEDNDSFSWADGCSGEFDFPVSTQVIPPGGSASAYAKLIRPCNARALFDYMSRQWNPDPSVSTALPPPMVINAKIRAKGHLGSGTIESPPFSFVVTACFGCLQTGYSLAAATAFEFPNVAKCSDLVSNPYLGEPCNSAQDQMILCCADKFDANGQSTVIHCPATPTGKD